ncbi:uncharacterized protein LOC144446454 [Glandiceps talaboti]
MDAFDTDNPDIPRLKSSMFQARSERYQITEAAPSHEPSPQHLKQVFDFGWLMKKHPHKYQSLVDKHMEETATEDRAKSESTVTQWKPERSVSSDDQNLGKKGHGYGLPREKGFSTPPPSPLPLAKRSSSYANIHDMKKSLPQDEKQRELYLKELNRELMMGRDDYVYDNDLYDEAVGGIELGYSVMGSRNSRNSSLVALSSFEEELEIATVTLPDGSEVEIPYMDAVSRSGSATPASGIFTPASSIESSPIHTPRASPRLKSRHELSAENMNCVPVELQPDKKRLFGVGPVYQPPSEQVCVQQDEAKQLNLLQRVVQEGFTATSKTFFHQREDVSFFPPDIKQNETTIDSAQTLKEKFLSKAEMNFLSPSSM